MHRGTNDDDTRGSNGLCCCAAERVSSVTLSHKVVAPRQLDMMSYNECNNNKH